MEDEEYFSTAYLDCPFPVFDLSELKKSVEEMEQALSQIKDRTCQ